MSLLAPFFWAWLVVAHALGYSLMRYRKLAHLRNLIEPYCENDRIPELLGYSQVPIVCTALNRMTLSSTTLAPSQQSAGGCVWLETRLEVLRAVVQPMPSRLGHTIWNCDFTGACMLFSVVLKPVRQEAVFVPLNALKLYGLGAASWGGYQNLAIPQLHPCSHCNKVGTGRPDGTAEHRAQRCRRFDRRSRKRFCRL